MSMKDYLDYVNRDRMIQGAAQFHGPGTQTEYKGESVCMEHQHSLFFIC